jgi:hypothetical protein
LLFEPKPHMPASSSSIFNQEVNVWGFSLAVPPYCTGHNPPPPRRAVVGARLALKRVSRNRFVNFTDFDVTLERNACFLRFEGSDLVAKNPRGKIVFLGELFSILEHLVHPCR